MLDSAAKEFLHKLHERFNKKRQDLLAKRVRRQKEIDQGKFPDFLPGTVEIRKGDWKVGPIPKDLLDRRVEITGPVDRKMVINALNSGAKVFMADFEDAHSPTWTGTLEGQQNLFDAVRRKITFRSPEGKDYQLVENPAVLMVRPRGLHLEEKHFLVDGERTSGSLFDFGLFLFHNAHELLKLGAGPYFYIPKLECHLEARFWSEVIQFSEKELGLKPGTIKVTVLIETILAAFEMDEILSELRANIVGLNCGRWDYIFSFIKKFKNRSEFLFPDRSQITMETHFLNSYAKLLITTCHKRGASAMGGMAAQIPIKDNPAANSAAMAKVRADKEREVALGHDGTWVSHPGLVSVALDVFSPERMAGARKAKQAGALGSEGAAILAEDLLSVPKGAITESGLRTNINVALLYMEAWLRGQGCVPLYHLMEDAATAEISRAQVWHWIHHPEGKTEDGRKVTLERVLGILEEERVRAGAKADRAAALLAEEFSAPELADFLTLRAYEVLK